MVILALGAELGRTKVGFGNGCVAVVCHGGAEWNGDGNVVGGVTPLLFLLPTVLCFFWKC